MIIPNRCITQFRINKPKFQNKKQRQKFYKEQGSRASEQTAKNQAREYFFSFSSLPPLPKIPDNLKDKLEVYASKYVTKEKGKIHQSKVAKKMKKKMNGFMAYRSFYTKNINNVTQQTELSAILAKSWSMDDVNQTIWKRYATQYNKESSNTPFVEWLHKELNILGGKGKEEINSENECVSSNGRMEDIFASEIDMSNFMEYTFYEEFDICKWERLIGQTDSINCDFFRREEFF
ncbi:hypothetical protein PACTADRAFT_33775 [Pachysolen tannophilus NRRL Y-2460]|uniref:Alpha box domain-containing protein n=1 Tax=Pachysolen tannophilus NRRL Y-2460 TaxID=669874 RepID=A0A1E4TTY1_PACTA|nr:hypothetical protein PACTADRAFT_33775 [Pachysolen tannophilus NRRL Y-2460]